MIDAAFGHWFAGFTDGEGCFDIHPIGARDAAHRAYVCRFTIGLRVDDVPILREIKDSLGIGGISFIARRENHNGQARFMVSRKAECVQLAQVFERFPLRAKKARDFLVWREAVVEWQRVRSRRKHDWSAIEELRAELRRAREFDAPEPEPRVARADPQLRLVG